MKRSDAAYFHKTLELRDQVQHWLSYVPATFPHYTRHTVDHSDEIVAQISSLLYHDGNPDRPVLDSSSHIVEAYICVASAYLHDAGMVTSDQEKEDLLARQDWRAWTEPGSPAGDRLAAIEGLRSSGTPSDSSLRHFVADRQLRFLIAEFIRRTHHKRAASVIAQNQSQLGRFAFDDPRLARAITNVCVGHGLSQLELEDPSDYPTIGQHKRAARQTCAFARFSYD